MNPSFFVIIATKEGLSQREGHRWRADCRFGLLPSRTSGFLALDSQPRTAIRPFRFGSLFWYTALTMMLLLTLRWLVFCMLVFVPCAAAAEPSAWVELGRINVEHGLSCLNAADGQNEPATVGGEICRRNVIDGESPSHFFYFDYDPTAGRLRRPIYVTVEYFDEGFGTFRIQYDSADLRAPERGAYKDGPAEILLDSRKWRKVTFELPDARFDGRQALGADFRLVCSGSIAVRKVVLEMERSPDFERQPEAQRERVAACVGRLVPPRGVQITFGASTAVNAAETSRMRASLRILAPTLKALGATSFESYVRWDLVEPKHGQWDWSSCDQVAAILRENGLKWSPIFSIGPVYAVPAWFRDSEDSVPLVCLEHGQAGRAQSIWNPKLPDYVDRFVAEFAARYGPSGSIESVLVSIDGDFGEAAYPAGGGPSPNAPERYHAHRGFWCGDRHARADFRHHIESRYGAIEALNAAWGTRYSSFDEVVPFLPEAAPSPQARLDFIRWYRGRMVNWAGFWLSTVRKYFPRTDIYLCTGGNGAPELGCDLAAQCKLAAKYRAGVRITDRGSDYAQNFAVTRLAAAAGRHYGAYCAFEAARDVTPKGIAARVYNASTSGARGFHTYGSDILPKAGAVAAWSDAYRWLGARAGHGPKVAVFFPRTSLPPNQRGFYEKIELLRDVFDFDLVDESMIRDGALRHYKALVLIDGGIVEREDVRRMLDWVKAGGAVVAGGFDGFASAEGDAPTFSNVFDVSGDRSPTVKSCGSGLALYVAGSWEDGRNLATGIAHALDTLSTRARANLVPDGVADGIYVSDLGGSLLVFNSTDREVERELQVGIGRRRRVNLPAAAITEVRE